MEELAVSKSFLKFPGLSRMRGLDGWDLAFVLAVLEMDPILKISGGQDARATGGPGILPGALCRDLVSRSQLRPPWDI